MRFTHPITRCAWPADDAQMIRYHDAEWGVPVRDDRELYEHLVLDGMQAGLSWRTILYKRDNLRRAFGGFDPHKVARYDRRKIDRLLADPGIIRNRQKIDAAITNARCWLAMRERGEGFADFLWRFVDGQPLHNRRRAGESCPDQTPASQAMSKSLKQQGFKFVGPTICYAFMQAVGMVNDHSTDCFRYAQLTRRTPDQSQPPGGVRPG